VSSFFYLKCLRTGLQLFPPEEWLVGASLPSKYVPSRINMILDELSPKRVRYAYTVCMATYIIPASIRILSYKHIYADVWRHQIATWYCDSSTRNWAWPYFISWTYYFADKFMDQIMRSYGHQLEYNAKLNIMNLFLLCNTTLCL
jgi:hypothetical protein